MRSRRPGGRPGCRAGRAQTAQAAVLAAGLILGVATGPAPAQEAGAAPVLLAEAATGPAASEVPFDLPVLINGRYVGDIAVLYADDGLVFGDADTLIALLAPLITESALSEAQAAGLSGSRLLLNDLQAGPIGFAVDPGELTIQLTVPLDVQRPQVLDLASEAAVARNVSQPEWFAGGVSVFASQRYLHAGTGDAGWQPLEATVDGFLNLGGFEGVYLASEFFYEERGATAWRRGNVTLFHDNPETAVRTSAGDVIPLGAGFQGTPILGGIGIQRLYEELQPSRNFRASGRNRFTLERDASVDIEVNGFVVQSLRLPAGTYDVRNLPFFDGLNDFVIVVQDDSGRRELVRQSLFFDSSLLDEGVSLFEVVIGQAQRTTGSGIDYAASPALTAFVQYGLSNLVTVGANVQADRHVQMGGAELAWATPMGTMLIEGAFSHSEQVGTGHAMALGYSWQGDLGGAAPQIDIAAEWRSRNFTVLDDPLPLNPFVFSVSARYEQLLFEGIRMRAAGAYVEGRDAEPDQTRLSLGLSRDFGPFFAFVSLDHERQDDEVDNRLLATLSYRFGPRDIVRGRVNTGRDEMGVEYQRLATNRLEDVSGRVALSRNDDRTEGSGEVDLRSNRFRAVVRHEYIENTDDGSLFAHQTRLDVNVGAGFADGRIAFGRAVDRGFMIFDPSLEMEDTQVDIGRRFGETGARGRTDGLGPVLVPVERPYAPEVLDLDLPDNVGERPLTVPQVTVLPGAHSGYVFDLAFDSSLALVAILAQADGAPLTLISGRLRPVDGPAGADILFFTNRNGRLYAEGLVPGAYDLFLGEADSPVAQVTVPEGAASPVDGGTIRVRP